MALSTDLSHRLRTAFGRGSGHGLLQLGAAEVGTMRPPVFGYWREFGARYVKPQHLPLRRALTAYAGAANRSGLLSLLVPVQRAATQCGWLKTMVDSGEIFEPLRCTPAGAYQLLTDLSHLEAACVIVRVPGTWRANRPCRPQVSAVVGAKPPTGLGTDALLVFPMDVTLDGEHLTASEIDEALRHPDALARVDPGNELQTRLRPGQQTGVRWLHLLSSLGLGACLADDMGLGKTMQILALLLAPRGNFVSEIVRRRCAGQDPQ